MRHPRALTWIELTLLIIAFFLIIKFRDDARDREHRKECELEMQSIMQHSMENKERMRIK